DFLDQDGAHNVTDGVENLLRPTSNVRVPVSPVLTNREPGEVGRAALASISARLECAIQKRCEVRFWCVLARFLWNNRQERRSFSACLRYRDRLATAGRRFTPIAGRNW